MTALQDLFDNLGEHFWFDEQDYVALVCSSKEMKQKLTNTMFSFTAQASGDWRLPHFLEQEVGGPQICKFVGCPGLVINSQGHLSTAEGKLVEPFASSKFMNSLELGGVYFQWAGKGLQDYISRFPSLEHVSIALGYCQFGDDSDDEDELVDVIHVDLNQLPENLKRVHIFGSDFPRVELSPNSHFLAQLVELTLVDVNFPSKKITCPSSLRSLNIEQCAGLEELNVLEGIKNLRLVVLPNLHSLTQTSIRSYPRLKQIELRGLPEYVEPVPITANTERIVLNGLPSLRKSRFPQVFPEAVKHISMEREMLEKLQSLPSHLEELSIETRHFALGPEESEEEDDDENDDDEDFNIEEMVAELELQAEQQALRDGATSSESEREVSHAPWTLPDSIKQLGLCDYPWESLKVPRDVQRLRLTCNDLDLKVLDCSDSVCSEVYVSGCCRFLQHIKLSSNITHLTLTRPGAWVPPFTTKQLHLPHGLRVMRLANFNKIVSLSIPSTAKDVHINSFPNLKTLDMSKCLPRVVSLSQCDSLVQICLLDVTTKIEDGRFEYGTD